MADVTIGQLGKLQGNADLLEGFMKVFAGEVITAFERSTNTVNRHMVRTIENGKSASFPIMGRTNAHYLKPGKNLDDLRENIVHNELVIQIDGLLTADCLISDIEEAMLHYDVRGEYSKQLGESLALAADGAVLAEIAKLVVADTENITGLGKGAIIDREIAAASIGITEATGMAIVEILLEVGAKMTKNRVPKTERYCYLDPDYYMAVVRSLVAINRDYGGLGNIADGNVLRVAGFELIEVPHLTIGGATATDAFNTTGHIFPAAYDDVKPLIICHRTAVGTVKLRDLALEQARRPEYQADQMIAKYAMGHGGLRPESAFIGTISASV